MLEVNVRLHSVLRHRDGQTMDELHVELADSSTVMDLLGKLGIGTAKDILVSVNERVADRCTILSDGDTITVIPLISGG